MSFRIAILSAAVFTVLALCVPDLLMRIFTSERGDHCGGCELSSDRGVSYILAAFTNCISEYLSGVIEAV